MGNQKEMVRVKPSGDKESDLTWKPEEGQNQRRKQLLLERTRSVENQTL